MVGWASSWRQTNVTPSMATFGRAHQANLTYKVAPPLLPTEIRCEAIFSVQSSGPISIYTARHRIGWQRSHGSLPTTTAAAATSTQHQRTQELTRGFFIGDSYCVAETRGTPPFANIQQNNTHAPLPRTSSRALTLRHTPRRHQPSSSKPEPRYHFVAHKS